MANDDFCMYLVATRLDGSKVDHQNFLGPLGVSTFEKEGNIVGFDIPAKAGAQRSGNVTLCHVKSDDYETPVLYSEAKDQAMSRACLWIEKRSSILSDMQTHTRINIYVATSVSNRTGVTFPFDFVRVCNDAKLMIDLDVYVICD